MLYLVIPVTIYPIVIHPSNTFFPSFRLLHGPNLADSVITNNVQYIENSYWYLILEFLNPIKFLKPLMFGSEM